MNQCQSLHLTYASTSDIDGFRTPIPSLKTVDLNLPVRLAKSCMLLPGPMLNINVFLFDDKSNMNCIRGISKVPSLISAYNVTAKHIHTRT